MSCFRCKSCSDDDVRVQVWGINYSPEVTGIAPYNVALCESLVEAGHSVRMITSFCYYPAWQKLPTERHLLARTDEMDGVTVHRCWHYVPKKVTTRARVLHELSFVAASFLRQLVLPRSDVLVVVSPPLLLGVAAWVLCFLKRTKFVFHVQDLQPDAAAGLGMVKEGWLLKALRLLERFAYGKAALVSGITPGMLQNFANKGVPAEKCVYFPNGVELPDFWRMPKRGEWRAAHGFGEADFLVIYSGNIGRKQGLDTLLRAMTEVKDASIRLVLCGDGAEVESLREEAKRLRLASVTFLGLQPESHYRGMLADADLCVIPQRSGSGGCFFPSKLLATLAHSCPVMAITDEDTELARACGEAGFGVVALPGDPAQIAREIVSLAGRREALREMGRAGFKFVKRFEQGAVLGEFRSRLEAVGL